MEARIARVATVLRDQLQPCRFVAAVFRNGSHVAGTAQADSDIDFTVLVQCEEEVEAAHQRLTEAFAFRGLCHEVHQYSHEGQDIACTMLTREAVEGMVGGVFASRELLLAYQGALQHKVVEAVAVHDPEGLLAAYQQRLRAYPEALAAEVVTWATDHLQEEYLDDWGFRSRFHYGFCLRDMLEHMALALYARNRRFCMPPLKRWPGDLRVLRPDLEPEATVLLAAEEQAGYARPREALARAVAKLRRDYEKG
jgi:hypothetical protein